jgi:thiamine transport system permease protein
VGDRGGVRRRDVARRVRCRALLRRPETTTLPVAIAERLGRPGASSYAEALLLALLLAALVAVVVGGVDALGRRRGPDPF